MELEKIIEKTTSLKLLYVEDDEILRISTLGVFEDFFENIYVATNGKDALEIFAENSIDLIITDISMPIMDGIEMINKIRLIDKNTPILIISAFNEADIVNDAIRSGINGYIFKPIELEQFCEEILKIYQ